MDAHRHSPQWKLLRPFVLHWLKKNLFKVFIQIQGKGEPDHYLIVSYAAIAVMYLQLSRLSPDKWTFKFKFRQGNISVPITRCKNWAIIHLHVMHKLKIIKFYGPNMITKTQPVGLFHRLYIWKVFPNIPWSNPILLLKQVFIYAKVIFPLNLLFIPAFEWAKVITTYCKPHTNSQYCYSY